MVALIEKSDERLLRMMALAKEYNEIDSRQNDLGKPKISTPKPDGDKKGPYRLVYTSARTPNCDDDSIKDILEAAARNKPALGLTGILVFTPNRFLQILEGPFDNVIKVCKKIEKDSRHGGPQRRYCQPAKDRHFGNWHMAHKGIEKRGVNFATAETDEEKELYAALMDGNLHDYKDDRVRVLKTFLMVS